MGFYAEFNAWLTTLLASYIGDNTARVAAVLEPAIVTLAVVYVMVWGYMQLTGKIEEPVMTGVKRIMVLTILLGGALHLWLYNDVIVDTFFNAPGQFAAGVIGAQDSVTVIDRIILLGDDAAALLVEKGGIFDGDFGFYLAGFAVWLIVGLTAIYTIFLLSLSKIALSVLLALGPLFIALVMFETTKRFFEAWMAQLANFAFITILTVLVAALMMRLIASGAEQAAAQGGDIEIAHAVRVCMAAGLTFLVMRQVMPIASGLASGVALSTMGVMSAVVAWGFGRSARSTGQFMRGLVDRTTYRSDSMSRKAGYYLKQGSAAGVRKLAARWRDNTLRPH